jgi:hypothetical protein
VFDTIYHKGICIGLAMQTCSFSDIRCRSWCINIQVIIKGYVQYVEDLGSEMLIERGDTYTLGISLET